LFPIRIGRALSILRCRFNCHSDFTYSQWHLSRLGCTGMLTFITVSESPTTA
jgi:hypothetical protein